MDRRGHRARVHRFATGLAGTFTLNGFPSANKSVTVQWQESQQNFAIVAVTATRPGHISGARAACSSNLIQ